MAKTALPSFFSVSRAIQYTDGLLFGLRSKSDSQGKISEEIIPLEVREFSVRGAKSSHGDAYKLSTNDAKVTKDINSPNPQKVDSVFLDFETDRLRLCYGMNILAVSTERQACNDFSYTEKVGKFLQAFSAHKGFYSIAELLVWRIASGAALWRNYFGTDRKVTVKANEKVWAFNADDISIKKPCAFEKEQDKELIALVEAALSGKSNVLMLTIETDVTIGYGQEVFPSQELEMKKERNSKSKVLYSVPFGSGTTAAMHPQKIGAAIRAIDIWHPAVEKTGPLSIEPLGYSHQHQLSFRTPDTGTDLYTYLQNIEEVTEQLNKGVVSPQAQYLAACFIRGGVFSGSPNAVDKAVKKEQKAIDKIANKKNKPEQQDLAYSEDNTPL